MTRFIDKWRERFGVEFVCRTIGVPVSTYYARKTRQPSLRELQDRELVCEIHAAREGYRRVYGIRKTWRELHRRGVDVGRDRIARLMRTEGLEGVRRGKKRCTTTPDEAAAERARDLVRRDFTADSPNELWVADITYVRTWSGFVLSRLHPRLLLADDRRLATRDPPARRTRLRRARDGQRSPPARRRSGAHSDRGSQGGFNWSSQHLVMEVVRDGCRQASASDSCDARPDVVAGPAVGGAA